MPDEARQYTWNGLLSWPKVSVSATGVFLTSTGERVVSWCVIVKQYGKCLFCVTF